MSYKSQWEYSGGLLGLDEYFQRSVSPGANGEGAARSNETMTGWKLRLFGEFDLSSSDGTEIAALGRRDRAVLTYLILTPNQRESRERLAALLWSNRGEEQARHSLAQSTAVIRKALGDTDKNVVVSEPASLAIDWTKFDVDVLAFRELVDEGTLEDRSNETMTGWKLRLFGEFDLSSSDGTEIAALGRRDRAVLTYLILTPNQRESRERLAALLWSNRGEEQARHSLAQSTAVIRKALGDTDKNVVVSEPASLAIDWTKFDVDVLAMARGGGSLKRNNDWMETQAVWRV